MSLTDPIANMLTSVRNALSSHKETVDVPASKMVGKILDIFKKDGYIEDFRLLKNNAQGTFKVYLKYQNKKPAIIGLRKVSRPGLKVYVGAQKVPYILNGLGTAILSTDKGLVTDREARKIKTGGEVICCIW